MLKTQLTELDKQKLDKQISEAYDQILDNDHELHEKLDQLIEKKNWNGELRAEVSALHDDWYRLQHNVMALHDKKDGEPHTAECVCGGI